jgi:ABC-type glutathione transport system ATPase component
MYLGRIVEIGRTPIVISNPLHSYRRVLVAVVPEADSEKVRHNEHVALRFEEIPKLADLEQIGGQGQLVACARLAQNGELVTHIEPPTLASTLVEQKSEAPILAMDREILEGFAPIGFFIGGEGWSCCCLSRVTARNGLSACAAR